MAASITKHPADGRGCCRFDGRTRIICYYLSGGWCGLHHTGLLSLLIDYTQSGNPFSMGHACNPPGRTT